MAVLSNKNIWKVRRSYWIIAISILIIVLNFVFGATVLRRQESNSRELEDRVDGLMAAISARDSGPQQNVTAANFIQGLPESSGISSILDEVFKSAKANGLDVASADYNSEAFKNSSISRYEFTFPVEGRYRDIKKFLYELESSQRPFVIEELGLVSRKGGDGKTGLNIRMSVLYR